MSRIMGISYRLRVLVDPDGSERILAWIRQHADYRWLIAVVDDQVSALRNGTRAEGFERALNDLGKAFGFACERPDAERRDGNNDTRRRFSFGAR
jgi:hypothetical protein